MKPQKHESTLQPCLYLSRNGSQLNCGSKINVCRCCDRVSPEGFDLLAHCLTLEMEWQHWMSTRKSSLQTFWTLANNFISSTCKVDAQGFPTGMDCVAERWACRHLLDMTQPWWGLRKWDCLAWLTNCHGGNGHSKTFFFLDDTVK